MSAMPDGRARTQQDAVRVLRRIIGGVDRQTRSSYIREFEREFSAYTEVASYDDLVVEGYRADLVYVGDYHALPMAQRFAARLLGDLARRSTQVVLAMEMVFGRQQRILDDWLARRIDDEEFLERLRYRQDWGYPWEGFRDVLETARSHGVPVIGIDSDPRTGLRRIRRRDAYAARRIAECFLGRPRAKVVVFIGESHLARRHLPARVRAELARLGYEKREMTVVQNVDALWWQRLEAGHDHAEVVRLERGRYAVFNAAPLVKYEAYRQTLELWRGEGGADDVDLTPTVYGMVDAILGYLRVDRDRLVIGRRHRAGVRLADVYPEVYGPGSLAVVRRLMRRQGLDESEVEAILAHVARAGSCYVPRVNAILIGTFDMTHGGEEAAHFVNAALRGELYESWNGAPRPAVDRFYGAVLEEALGYFGSKLIDPSRNHFFETDLYRHHRDDAATVEARTGMSHSEFRAIIEFILTHKRFERTWRDAATVPEELRAGVASEGERFRVLTHELGYFLGQQLYDGSRRGLVPLAALLGLFRRSFRRPGSAVSAYLDWAERLAPMQ